MARDPEMMANMDQAAEESRAALREIFKQNPKVAAPLAAWWKDNYLKAGHKRLGRVLMGEASNAPGWESVGTETE